jgi:(p)ppGpp synthase/HD superfamily hydrolase
MTRAFDLAREVHADQTLKGTSLPYLLHLLDVCSIVLRHGADEDQAIAALLHDAVEDGGGRPLLARIEAEFGKRVSTIVEGCSDSTVVDPENKQPWWERKVAYVDHLPAVSEDVALVSAADKLSNARSTIADYVAEGEEFWDRFRGGRAGSIWYYCSIASAIPSRLPAGELPDRLGRALVSAVDELLHLVGIEQAERDLAFAEAKAAEVRAGR